MAAGRLIKPFLENRDAILGFIVAVTRDFDVAEEIFQEAAMVVIEEDRKQTAVANFMAWTREIIRRRIAEYYRKQTKRRAVERPSDELIDVVSLAFSENEAKFDDQQVRMQYLLECVKRLAGRSRDVIDGFYGKNKSVREIAASMGWEESSVKVALSRARKVLADCVQQRIRAEEAL